MKRLFVMGLFLCGLAISVQAQVERKPSKQGRSGQMHHGRNKGMQGEMVKDLNLSENQKAEIKKINEDIKAKMEALRNNKTITVGEAESRREALQKERKDRIQAVLTPDQRSQMEQRIKAKKEGQFQTGGIKPARQAHMKGDRMEHMKSELGLSENQGQQIKAINLKAQEQVKAIKENSTLSQEEKMSRIKAVRQDAKVQIERLLTPEQKAKMNQIRQERKAKFKEKNKGAKPKIS